MLSLCSCQNAPVSVGAPSVVALLGLNDPFLPHDGIQSTISLSQQSNIYSHAYTEGSDPTRLA